MTHDPAGGQEVPSRYRVHLLSDARPTERGILYRRGAQRFLLAWSRVRRAFAAEVGEPEGVRTIVFDLVVSTDRGECVVFRFDADPGEGAKILARAVELGAGSESCDACLRAVATDGFATRSFPDLEPFEEASLEAIRSKPLADR